MNIKKVKIWKSHSYRCHFFVLKAISFLKIRKCEGEGKKSRNLKKIKMSNKCSHALYFPKNMSLELGKIKKIKKRHFTTLHRRLFLIFVFKKKVMRQGKKAKNRIQFFYQFHINFLNGFFCSSIILSDSVNRGFRFFVLWLGGGSSLQAEVRNRKMEIGGNS